MNMTTKTRNWTLEITRSPDSDACRIGRLEPRGRVHRDHHHDVETNLEDAALIAAAPRLLAAAEAALSVIPGLEVRSWPPGFEMKETALRLLREAIAAAKAGA